MDYQHTTGKHLIQKKILISKTFHNEKNLVVGQSPIARVCLPVLLSLSLNMAVNYSKFTHIVLQTSLFYATVTCEFSNLLEQNLQSALCSLSN